MHTVDNQIAPFVSYLFKDILPLGNIVEKNMKNLEIIVTKMKGRTRKIFLQEGRKEILQLVEIVGDLVDIFEMVREFALQEVENVIMTTQSSLSLNVKSVIINNLVGINHSASFIILKVKMRMNGKLMREKLQRFVNMQSKVKHV